MCRVNKTEVKIHLCYIRICISVHFTIFTFQEKVKELDLRNIYSNRMLGSRMLPNSYSGTPMRNQSPTSPRRRAPSVHDLSSREKVRLYEERRREEERKQREVGYNLSKPYIGILSLGLSQYTVQGMY